MNMTNQERFPAAAIIKEIGRGKHGARSMTASDAEALYGAILQGRVSDLELGAIVLALRIKGESVAELTGFMQAAHQSFPALPQPSAKYAPILIPSYNGARKVANLTPLLALLLARAGAPVLLHGVTRDPGRITSAEIFQAMGQPLADSPEQVARDWACARPSFIPIQTLAPALARVLELRRILGVRNSTHTIVKLLQPMAGPALRLVSYTHPEYLALLTEYFAHAAPAGRGAVFLMRGTEGETVANAKRANQIEAFLGNVQTVGSQQTVLVERQGPVDEWPAMPTQLDAATTAQWISAALNGEVPVPAPIAEQVEHCLQVAKKLRHESDQSAA